MNTLFHTQNTLRRKDAILTSRFDVDKPSLPVATFIMETQEIWKDVIGYEGLYQVSNLGRVKSLPQKNTCCGRKMGNYIKARLGRAGYLYIAMRKNRVQSNYLLHRVIANSFIPNPENKPCINHINSIRTDNRIDNLEWVTYSENNSHAHKFGGQKKYVGENHSQSILTEGQVNQIRTKYKYRIYTAPMLAKEYGVSKGCIVAIIMNKTWKQ